MAKATGKQVVSWRINLKNGASVDLNVIENDQFDKDITKWVKGVAKRKRVFLNSEFEQGELWLNPDEFAMALRTPIVPPQIPEKFEKIEVEASKTA